MILSHKILLSPNNKQRSYFSRAVGIRKFSGSELVLINRWYPSSKICCECKSINKEFTLKCGCVLDRDVNASKNLEAWAMSAGDVRPMIQKSRIKGSSCEAGIEHPVNQQQVTG